MVYPIVADYMFSNEYMNYLITYSFDFRHEELLSYYISFLRFVFLLIKINCWFSLIHIVSLNLLNYLKFFCWIWYFNSMYCCFSRAISGKLDKNTISLLVKTQNVSFLLFLLFSLLIGESTLWSLKFTY